MQFYYEYNLWNLLLIGHTSKTKYQIVYKCDPFIIKIIRLLQQSTLMGTYIWSKCHETVFAKLLMKHTNDYLKDWFNVSNSMLQILPSISNMIYLWSPVLYNKNDQAHKYKEKCNGYFNQFQIELIQLWNTYKPWF